MISSIALLIVAAGSQPPLPPPPPKDFVWGLPLVEKVLATLSEPRLPKGEGPEKVVRIVMIPAVPELRIVVSRLTPRAGHLEVVTKTLVDWLPGPGKVATLPVARLAPLRWTEVDEALVPGLWQFKPPPDQRVLDGALWFVEASGPRGYQAVIQHSPTDNPFQRLCKKLMWASGVEFTEQEFVSWFAAR